MMGIEQFMGQEEALSGSVRRIAEFVPLPSIREPMQIPEAFLEAHIATEMSRRDQGNAGTTLEGHLLGKGDKNKIVVQLGNIGNGSLAVVRHALDQIENGAGDYANSISRHVLTHPEKPFSSGIQGELERAAAVILNQRAGSISTDLRLGMTEEAKERRAATYEKIENPFKSYSVNGRSESLRLPGDTRIPVISALEIEKILHDLLSSGEHRIVNGYQHLRDLFTGAIKGPQERIWLSANTPGGLKNSLLDDS